MTAGTIINQTTEKSTNQSVIGSVLSFIHVFLIHFMNTLIAPFQFIWNHLKDNSVISLILIGIFTILLISVLIFFYLTSPTSNSAIAQWYRKTTKKTTTRTPAKEEATIEKSGTAFV